MDAGILGELPRRVVVFLEELAELVGAQIRRFDAELGRAWPALPAMASAFSVTSCIFCTTSGGVLAGTERPFQKRKTAPG